MSTDITIDEPSERKRVSFDSFVRTEADRVARAVAVALGEDDGAARRTGRGMDHALRRALRRWDDIGYNDGPERFVYPVAVDAARDTDRPLDHDAGHRTDGPDEQGGYQAAIVAHHLLGWSRAAAASAFGITRRDLDAAIESAELRAEQRHDSAGDPVPGHHADRPTGAALLQSELVARAARARVHLPDPAIMQAARRKRVRRIRATIGVAGFVALVAGASIVASQLSSPAEVALPQSETSAPPTAAPTRSTAPPAPTAAATDLGGGDDQPIEPAAADEPPPTEVRTPHLITTSLDGTFAGARSPAFRSPRAAVFSASPDGLEWSFAGRWPLDDYEFVERFERVGDHYFAWVANALAFQPPSRIEIGISPDLTVWDSLVIELDDQAPPPVVLDVVVQDIAALDGNVLAIVRADVSIDFAVAPQFESETCGTAVSNEAAFVEFCDGTGLPALDDEIVSRLPDRTRLFVSTDGSAFEQVANPFEPNAAVELELHPDRFVLIREDGHSSATSTDGRSWLLGASSSGSTQQVDAVATNDRGEAAGVSRGAGGAVLLFHADAGGTRVTHVVDVIGREPSSWSAAVRVGPAGWVVEIRELDGSEWLVFSSTGRDWRLLADTGPARALERHVFVGDDEVVIQSVVGTGPVLTRIPVGDPATE